MRGALVRKRPSRDSPPASSTSTAWSADIALVAPVPTIPQSLFRPHRTADLTRRAGKRQRAASPACGTTVVLPRHVAQYRTAGVVVPAVLANGILRRWRGRGTGGAAARRGCGAGGAAAGRSGPGNSPGRHRRRNSRLTAGRRRNARCAHATPDPERGRRRAATAAARSGFMAGRLPWNAPGAASSGRPGGAARMAGACASRAEGVIR